MSTARATAARIRGCFVGACAAATAVGAHSLGGGGLPGGSSIVVLVLACAVIGAVASSANPRNHTLPVVALYLSVGQVIGHCVLALAAGHAHGDQWSLTMLVAHLLTALGGAALICAAERLLGALAGSIWRLVVVMVALRRGDEQRYAKPVWAQTGLAVRLVVCGGSGTRGPPTLAALA